MLLHWSMVWLMNLLMQDRLTHGLSRVSRNVPPPRSPPSSRRGSSFLRCDTAHPSSSSLLSPSSSPSRPAHCPLIALGRGCATAASPHLLTAAHHRFAPSPLKLLQPKTSSELLANPETITSTLHRRHRRLMPPAWPPAPPPPLLPHRRRPSMILF
jgi:hypothetical protein